MSYFQAIRHTAGLVMASLGGFGLLFTIGMAALAIDDQNAGQSADIGRLLITSTVLILVNLFLLWRGLVMRRRAIAAGSTIHIDANRFVQESQRTSRSGSPRPSFLEQEPDADEEGGGKPIH